MAMGEDRVRYAYILGASHSGTTLLALLLGAHPEVATIGELAGGGVRNAEGYRCSCRELVRDCTFWNELITAMRKHYASFDVDDFGLRLASGQPGIINRIVGAEHRGPVLELTRDALLGCSRVWRGRFSAFERRLETLGRAVLRVSGAKLIVDSSKLAHLLKYVRRVRGLDLKVIHMVRDGRAVALTYMNETEFADARNPALRRGGRGQNGETPDRWMSMSTAADEWRRGNRSAEFALASMAPGDRLRVRYEDLCGDLNAELARIAAFLDIDPTLFPADCRAVPQHVMGNGMRLDWTGEVELDERWKVHLNKEDLRTLESVAGEMNRNYGY